MAGQNTLTLNADNFDAEVIKSSVPVLVDFWAQWCGTCLMLAPTIEQLADTYVGKIKVGKVDVDQAPMLASQYSVQNIPTILLFAGGKVVERMVGVRQKRDFVTAIENHLPK